VRAYDYAILQRELKGKSCFAHELAPLTGMNAIRIGRLLHRAMTEGLPVSYVNKRKGNSNLRLWEWA
jgi:hypothetical protein